MSSSTQSNGVHFFKIIQKTNLCDGELKVPTSFAKMHWEGMSNPVTLRLPNKTEWKVEWKKDDEGDIWLCNGLKKFAKDLSLSEFQFLVFQYQDISSFNAIVFAKNGSEIKYSSVKETREEPEEVEESDCSVKVIDHAKRAKSLPQSSQPLKKRKTNPRDQKERLLSKQQSSQHHHKNKMKKGTTYGKKKVGAHSNFDNAAKHMDSGSGNDMKERIKKIHEYMKKHFPSKKDFFTCGMHRSYVNKDNMALPNEFCKQHLHKMDGRTVALFDVGKNKTWNVQLNIWQRQCTFTGGWIKFSRENILKVGDVCAFVFIKSKGLSFQVFRFRFEEDKIIPLFEVNNSDQEELLDRPSSSTRAFG